MIPIRKKAKTPAVKWEIYQHRIATADEVNGWFVEDPEINLAIVTGHLSGLAVVDADGSVGRAQLVEVGLTSSMSVLTGNGIQLYFKYEGDICNAVRKLPGLDIRGEGGYVVAPGSIHPNGKRYILQGSLTAATIQRLPPFPTAMFATMSASENSSKVCGPGWIGEALNQLSQGNRNDTFCRIIGRLHSDGWGTIDINNLLTPMATKVNFSIAELDRIIQSVSRYPVAGESSGSSISDTLEEFLRESKPVEWIVPGIIARNSLGFVAGLPETGKTWLLIDLAIELSCRGQNGKWLDKFTVNPATVLFIDQERFKGETQRRFKAVLGAKGISPDAVGGRLSISCGTSTRIDRDDSYAAFRRTLEHIRPDIVVVDSFATFHTSEENDRGQIQKVLERLKQLRNEFSCAFVFIDHETKSVWNDRDTGEAPSAFRMAGSVGKAAAAEFVLTVRKSDNGAAVYHTKSTLGKAVEAFAVEIKDTETGVSVNAVRE